MRRLRTHSEIIRLVGCFTAVLFLIGCDDEKGTGGDGTSQGADYYPAWSPDGRSIAYLHEDVDDSTQLPNYSLRTIDLASELAADIWQVPEGMSVWDLTWSPDCVWLLFASDEGIFKIQADGDSLDQLVSGQFLHSPSWSRTKNRIFYSGSVLSFPGVYSVGPEGQEVDTIFAPSSRITTLRCFWDDDSLLVSQFVPSSGGECLVAVATTDSVVGSALFCGASPVEQIRIGRNRDLLLFLGRPTLTQEFAIYHVSRGSGMSRKISAAQSFDLAPNDSDVVFADTQLLKRLKVVNVYTGHSRELTHGDTRRKK